jgi:hypothetical protein
MLSLSVLRNKITKVIAVSSGLYTIVRAEPTEQFPGKKSMKEDTKMRCLTVICAMFALVSTVVATDSMTHEETVVRTAYAKLAYASEQHVVIQLGVESQGDVTGLEPSRLTNDQRLAAANANFTLSDFVIGNVEDIINHKVSDYVTPQGAAVLLASESTFNFAEGGAAVQSRGIGLRWQSQSVPLPPEGAPEMKLSEMYQVQWHQDRPAALWQRYASYSVTVSFLGKTRGPY